MIKSSDKVLMITKLNYTFIFDNLYTLHN